MNHMILFFSDDDPDDLHFMKTISESLGHSGHTFPDPTVMLDVLQKGEIHPDLIFLDISMPKADGYQILSTLRADDKYSRIPIIIHTGNSDENVVNRCFDLKADYYIRKANTFAALKSAIAFAANRDWKAAERRREDFLHPN